MIAAQRWLFWLDRMPLAVIALITVFLGLAPFVPEPHLWEKFGMLISGTLTRPIDIFDLLWHGSAWILLALKIRRMVAVKNKQ